MSESMSDERLEIIRSIHERLGDFEWKETMDPPLKNGSTWPRICKVRNELPHILDQIDRLKAEVREAQEQANRFANDIGGFLCGGKREGRAAVGEESMSERMSEERIEQIRRFYRLEGWGSSVPELLDEIDALKAEVRERQHAAQKLEAEIKTLIDVALAAETLAEDLREEASLTAESSGSHHELMNRLYVLKETR